MLDSNRWADAFFLEVLPTLLRDRYEGTVRTDHCHLPEGSCAVKRWAEQCFWGHREPDVRRRCPSPGSLYIRSHRHLWSLSGMCCVSCRSSSRRSPVKQIVLAFVSLYDIMGWPAFVGVAVMIVSIPLNTVIARFLKRLQEQQMKNRDKRTRLMSELLANIRRLEAI